MAIEHEIRISDFGTAAAILSCGFSIRCTDKDGRRVFFVFDNSDELQKVIDDYRSGDLVVSARRYFENTKMLKDILYNE
jgi:hypothetical protein